jgi:hypothetical protein
VSQSGEPGSLNLLANAELTRRPQPTYKMLRESSPVMRVDGIGVLVSSWELVDEVLHKPEIYSDSVPWSGVIRIGEPSGS